MEENWKILDERDEVEEGYNFYMVMRSPFNTLRLLFQFLGHNMNLSWPSGPSGSGSLTSLPH